MGLIKEGHNWSDNFVLIYSIFHSSESEDNG